MTNCWASSLGECSEKISREHYISKSLFPDRNTVSVSGFPWCDGETKLIGLASLTSKILCKDHNSSLSPLDTAAGAAFKSFNDCALLSNDRLAVDSPKFKIRHFHINGLLFERWLLKTLINLCRESGFHLGRTEKVLGIPSEHLVRICFGKEKFHGKSGLYLTAREGAEINSKPEFGFIPIIEEKTSVIGGFFNFRGFLFFLSLFEEPLPDNFDWITSLDSSIEWKGTNPSWHFRKIKFKVNNVDSHVLHFNWK